MNVSESKFRQILREEARRVLREIDTPTGQEASAPAAGTGATPQTTKEASWSAVDTALGTLIQQTPSFVSAQNIIKSARGAWSQCIKPESATSLRVAASIAAKKTDTVGVQLASALLALTNEMVRSGGEIVAFAPVEGGANFVDAIIAILENAGKTLIPLMKTHLSTKEPTPAPTPTAVGAPYTVLKGESISAILKKKYSPPVPLSNASMTMYKAVAAANNVDTKTFVIQPGQPLQLPATLTGSAGIVHKLIRQ